MTVPAYYVTDDDLSGLDKKTLAGLSPLTGQLNLTLGQIIGAVNGIPTDDIRQLALAIDTTFDSVFPLTFSTTIRQPKAVVLGNCSPRDPSHSLATPFVVQNWSLTSSGLVSVPAITGLLVSNTYDLTFWIR